MEGIKRRRHRMRLYKVKTKNKELYHFIVYYDLIDAKTHIQKNVSWLEADFRTLSEIPFPEGRFECSNLDGYHAIFFNGEKIVDWDDDAARCYPEDLTWDRDISLLISQVEKLAALELAEITKKRAERK
jgi:hypothetical protein